MVTQVTLKAQSSRESGPGVFADDGAFAFGSRRDIELGARILHDHCVRCQWGMMPHTAGKTVAMYFGQPVVNLRGFLPDEAVPPQMSRWGTEKRQ